MWISNTATTAMMLPIAQAVLDQVKADNLQVAILKNCYCFVNAFSRKHSQLLTVLFTFRPVSLVIFRTKHHHSVGGAILVVLYWCYIKILFDFLERLRSFELFSFFTIRARLTQSIIAEYVVISQMDDEDGEAGEEHARNGSRVEEKSDALEMEKIEVEKRYNISMFYKSLFSCCAGFP